MIAAFSESIIFAFGKHFKFPNASYQFVYGKLEEKTTDMLGSVFALPVGMYIRVSVIFLAGLCLAACSHSSPAPAPTAVAPPSATASVSIVSGARALGANAYSPSPLTVAVGTTVTWVNNDTAPHNSTADNGNFATGTISPGASASVKLTTAGSFVYHCTIHPGMVGTVVVQ